MSNDFVKFTSIELTLSGLVLVGADGPTQMWTVVSSVQPSPLPVHKWKLRSLHNAGSDFMTQEELHSFAEGCEGNLGILDAKRMVECQGVGIRGLKRLSGGRLVVFPGTKLVDRFQRNRLPVVYMENGTLRLGFMFPYGGISADNFLACA